MENLDDKLMKEILSLQDIFNKTTKKIIKDRVRNQKIMSVSDKRQKAEYDELLKKVNEVELKNQEITRLLKVFDENIITSKTDLAGNITYVSKAFCEISQYSKEELIGKPHNIVRHPDMPKSAFEDLWKTIKSENVWKGEVKNRKKDGSFYWVRTIISPDYIDGKLCGYSAIRHDITVHKQVEELSLNLEKKVQERTSELNDEKKYINSVINSQVSMVITTDGKSIKSTNKAFLRFYNVSSNEEFYKKFGDCICNTFDEKVSSEFIKKDMNGIKWIDYVYLNSDILHKVKIVVDDKNYIFSITADKFIYKDKELITIVFNDITELERIREDVENSNQRIGTLLNNVKQGFLYFNEDMIIGSEYSKEVIRIFGKEVASKDITTILYKYKDEQVFLKSTLVGLLDESEIRQEILLSLLQKDFIINGRNIEVEYKILDKSNFMMILTDITDKIKYEKKIKREHQILKMVVEVVTSMEQFVEIKTNYINLILFINNYKSLDMLGELRREIHTYKGLFAQKEMLNIVQKLHDFETQIDISLKQNELTDMVKDITYNTMNSWIEEDIFILKDILGEDFFVKSNHILIDKARICKLQTKIKSYIEKKSLVGESTFLVLKDIEELKYNSAGTLFHPFEKLVEQLSKRLGKDVNPLILEGVDIYIPNMYKSFIHSLVHIFRNSLDHGLELPEERYELNKPLKGTIKAIIEYDDMDNIIISISDDGKGIDPKVISEVAISRGIVTVDEINIMAEEDILMLIFKDGFTTSNNITDLSGRGVGMASVLEELKRIGGDLTIHNNLGFGVEFVFTLPSHNDNDTDVEMDILNKLSIRVIEYFKEYFNINIDSQFMIEEVDEIEKGLYGVIIPLTNDMVGNIYMGVSKDCAYKLVEEYLDNSMSDDEIEELTLGNIAEILNITLGNILKELSIMQNGGIIGIEPPKILGINKTIIKENNSKILISQLIHNNNEIILGYFI